MLDSWQRSVVFYLVCAFAVAGVAVEIAVILKIVFDGAAITQSEAIISAVAGSVAVAFGWVLRDMAVKSFLTLAKVPVERLHRYGAERAVIHTKENPVEDQYVFRQVLVSTTLKFAEECLRGWIPGTHLELCVFVDRTQPILFAYFDSKHATKSRSMAEREQKPFLYVDKGYEVAKLLNAPTSMAHIIDDTQASDVAYFFASTNQKRQLRSSILLCVDVETPCALVISSDAKEAFSRSDTELHSFLNFVAAQVRCDVLENDFISDVRKLRPNLFVAS